jgi:hypothetical protein
MQHIAQCGPLLTKPYHWNKKIGYGGLGLPSRVASTEAHCCLVWYNTLEKAVEISPNVSIIPSELPLVCGILLDNYKNRYIPGIIIRLLGKMG